MLNPIENCLKVQANQLDRVQSAAKDTAMLAVSKPRPEVLAEGLELASATVQRVAQLQKNWAQDWGKWGHYCWTLAGADTAPKIMERSNNIALQAQAQVASQMNELTELVENIGVSYAFWVHRQVREARRD